MKKMIILLTVALALLSGCAARPAPASERRMNLMPPAGQGANRAVADVAPAPATSAPAPAAGIPNAPAGTPHPLQMYIDVAHSTRMSYEELVGDNGDYSEPNALAPPEDYWIEIDTTNNIMIVWDKNEKPVRIMLCTTGESETDTPRGSFVVGKRRERFGYFDKFDCYAQYWTQFNGPYFIHSLLYSERSAKSLMRNSYKNLGRSTSHGCVRLTVPDARWIYENIPPGTVVKIVAKKRDTALKDILKLPAPPQPIKTAKPTRTPKPAKTPKR